MHVIHVYIVCRECVGVGCVYGVCERVYVLYMLYLYSAWCVCVVGVCVCCVYGVCVAFKPCHPRLSQLCYQSVLFISVGLLIFPKHTTHNFIFLLSLLIEISFAFFPARIYLSFKSGSSLPSL